MVLKSSFSILVVATLAVFSSYTPVAEAHSWADCIDWKFNNPKKQDWTDKGGKCTGYARRFPLGLPFGSLDSQYPNRHYQQDRNNPRNALPCSNFKDGSTRGSDETRAKPTSAAYGGKWGRMTTTTIGDTLCVRWPAKNHAKIGGSIPTTVFIHMSPVRNGKDITQAMLLKNTIAKLQYTNCIVDANEDRRACGGCFKVPARAPGTYLMQWRWELNPGEFYTSCADVKISKPKK
ncbi:hypothetical protein BGZ67_009828 [Mortierella alpina]|nr:hypothetical protein BGZ67_009828 [Mortierella alpina]